MKARNRVLAGILLTGLLFLVPTPASAWDRDFNRIVDRLSEHYGHRPMSGMGFMSFMARCFMPSDLGISGLRMAVFEGAKAPKEESLDEFIASVVEPKFQPFVRVRSHKDGERVWIYCREDGKKIELLLVNLEPSEAVVMKMKIQPETFSKWMEDPEGMTRKVSK